MGCQCNNSPEFIQHTNTFAYYACVSCHFSGPCDASSFYVCFPPYFYLTCRSTLSLYFSSLDNSEVLRLCRNISEIIYSGCLYYFCACSSYSACQLLLSIAYSY